MAFQWKSLNDNLIETENIKEIQGNMDHLHDNIACITEDSTYNATLHNTFQTCPARYSNDDSSFRSPRTTCSSLYGTFHTGQHTNHTPSENSTVYGSANATRYATRHTTLYSTNNSDQNGMRHGTFETCTTRNATVNSNRWSGYVVCNSRYGSDNNAHRVTVHWEN